MAGIEVLQKALVQCASARENLRREPDKARIEIESAAVEIKRFLKSWTVSPWTPVSEPPKADTHGQAACTFMRKDRAVFSGWCIPTTSEYFARIPGTALGELVADVVFWIQLPGRTEL